MFSRRLRHAFLLMGLLALAQGALAWWVLGLAEHRIIRGRLAGQLQSGLQEISAEKHRLSAWVLEQLLGAAPDPALGPALVAAMQQRITGLRTVGAEAERLDRDRGKDPAGHAARQEALRRLDAALLAMLAEIDRLPASGTGPLPAWERLDALLDGQALRQVLRDALRAEAASVAEERRAADASLARARLLALGGTLLLLGLALLLALWFTAALRRPVLELQAGATALGRGRLDHRVPPQADGEFAALAGCMNSLAEELAQSRAAEQALREGLERQVAARTEALSAALAELSEADAQRRQLLADIGHELRTPATVLRGEVEVALRAPTADAAEYRQVLERLRDTARQLGDLVEDVLVLGSADVAALSLDCTRVQAEEALHAVVQAWRFLARERGVTLHLADADDAALWADPSRLRQVLGALVDNAVRYSRPGGEVTLTAMTDQAAALWRLEIADRGIGIAAAEVPRLFARGYRTAAAREHRADGTGLGLAIARALAERQGGEVTLVPRPGGGAVARLAMPLMREVAA